MQQLSENTLLLRSTDWSTKKLVDVADESCVRWQVLIEQFKNIRSNVL